MSTTKFVSAAAVLCIGLAVSVAVVEARRERVARDGLNEAKRNQDRLIARVTEAEVRARTARGEVITAQEVLERKRAGAARARVPSEEEVAGRALLAAHPAVKEALRSTLRASIRAQHYLLYRELGLSEAQQAAFEDIKLDGEEGLTRTYSHDIGLALPVGEGISSSEVSRRLFRLLGKEGYDKYMSGEFGLKGNPVTALASALYFGDEPLSTEQARQLVRARSEEFTVTTFEERKADPGKLWVGVAERARDFLTEGQMEALQLLKLRDEFHLRPRETIKEAAAPAGRRP